MWPVNGGWALASSLHSKSKDLAKQQNLGKKRNSCEQQLQQVEAPGCRDSAQTPAQGRVSQKTQFWHLQSQA